HTPHHTSPHSAKSQHHTSPHSATSQHHTSPHITTHHHTSPHSVTSHHHTTHHITSPHHITSAHITTHHHTTHHHTSPLITTPHITTHHKNTARVNATDRIYMAAGYKYVRWGVICQARATEIPSPREGLRRLKSPVVLSCPALPSVIVSRQGTKRNASHAKKG